MPFKQKKKRLLGYFFFCYFYNFAMVCYVYLF